MDAEKQHPTWGINEEKLLSGDQVVGRQKLAHHQKCCSDIFGGVFNAMSHPYDFCCCR